MWVPVDSCALAWLPKPGGRPYTQVEALVSLQADYWQRRPASLRGYEAQWGWGRRRVADFLGEVGVEIVGQKGRKLGQLRPRHRNDTTNDTENDTTTTPQLFRDFGQIGHQPSRNVTTSDTAGDPKTTPTSRQERHTDNTPPPPNPLQVPRSGPGGGGQNFEELARQVVEAEQRNGRKIKDIARYQAAVARRLEAQGGLSPEEKEAITPSWFSPETEKTRKYLDSQEF